MFLLDTNVLSAVMSSKPTREVTNWIARQPVELLFTTSVCQAEILSGLAILPAGRRRRALEVTVHDIFLEDFQGRVLPFDTEAAAIYAELFAARRRMGRPAASLDLMIASVARCHNASVVTRDLGGFEGCGLTLINPWETP